MEKVKTTNIHGKEYVEVPERIYHFWRLHPEWSLKSQLEKVCFETGNVIFKCWVEDENGKVKAVGHAHEFQANKKATVNLTSFVENCETSAYGRALGFKGIGSRDGIASAEEVRGAIEKGNEIKTLDKLPEQVNKMIQALAGLGVTQDDLVERLGHSLEGVTPNEIEDLKKYYSEVKRNESTADTLNRKFG